MKKEFMKKMIASILAVLFVASCVFLQPTAASEAQAGDVVTGNSQNRTFHVERLDVSQYKGAGTTIPTPTGAAYTDWKFAGWFTDAGCSVSLEGSVKEGIYYAKFVPSEILTVKCQLSNQAADDGTYKLRIVSSVDNLKYQRMGFKVKIGDKTENDRKITEVYRGIRAEDGGVDYNYFPTIFDNMSDYFATLTIVKIPEAEVNGENPTNIKITPYWVTLDGTRVDGTVRNIKIATDKGTPDPRAKLADTDWYDDRKTEFTIYNAAELYGLAELSATNDFAGVTIKLGADITVNGTDANEWSEEPPLFSWTPIHNFAGTFDGQGHTISGLYMTNAKNAGLFEKTESTSAVKNLRVVNSYFSNTTVTANDADRTCIGGISGHGGGSFDTIYSDVIITSSGVAFGGIIGNVEADNTKETQITNCCFAGKISMTEKGFTGAGIVGGAYQKVLIKNCLNSGTISAEGKNTYTRAAGILGVIGNSVGGGVATIVDCINAGTVTSTNSNQTGSVVGYAAATCNVTNVYTTDINMTACGNAAKLVGTILREADLTGEQAGGLDFTTYWKSATDSTPTLKCFEIDRRWYDESKFQGTSDDPYVISTAAELYGLAEISQSDNFENQTIKLGADITVNSGYASEWKDEAPERTWTPIGYHNTNSAPEFAGTFDGQGHTISGIYMPNMTNNCGFFGKVASAKLKDFKLVNSYFAVPDRNGFDVNLGAIAGSGEGSFDTIYTNAIVSSNGGRIGGFIGAVTDGDDAKINNCWFDGMVDVYGEGYSGGGLIGEANKSCKVTVKNFLNTGTINFTSTCGDAKVRTGGIIGGVNGGAQVTLEDCLVAGTVQSERTSKTGAVVGALEDVKTSKLIISAGGNVYATTQCHPKDVGNRATVESTAYPEVVTGTGAIIHTDITNLYGAQAEDLDFDNIWTALPNSTPVLTSVEYLEAKVEDTSWWDGNTQGGNEYTLYNAADLYGFSKISQSYNFANDTIKLGADITVNPGDPKADDWANNRPLNSWTPIGYHNTNSAPEFAGTFDGQGHTISGIYMTDETDNCGFFGRVASAKLKNFKLVNSYFAVPNRNGAAVNLGAIAGSGEGSFDTIYTNAIVSSDGGNIGGFIGAVTNGTKVSNGEDTKINNCWFAGTVDVNGTGGYGGGGLIGCVDGSYEVTVKNFLNTGTINFTSTCEDAKVKTGGIIGGVNGGAQVTLEDCLVAGTVQSERTSKTGAVVGALENVSTSKLIISAGGNVYATTQCHPKDVGNRATVEGTAYPEVVTGTGAIIHTDITSLYGAQAEDLDFDNIWTAFTDSTPVLTSFYK